MNSRYLKLRQETESAFADSRVIPETHKVSLSPTGTYKLEVDQYLTAKNGYTFSRGFIRRVKDGGLIADVIRSYWNFWHAWVHYPNRQEYLFCGPEPLGYSAIYLARGTTTIYFPEMDSEDWGFSWFEANPSPNQLVLAVSGEGDSEYGLRLYDISHPERMPYPVLGRLGPHLGNVRWASDRVLRFTKSHAVRKSTGQLFDTLPDPTDPDILEYRDERIRLDVSSYLRR